MNKNLDEIKKEILELQEQTTSEELSKKYAIFSRSVLIAHYVVFLTIVWKSFDLGGNIPILAKVSLFLFFIGGVMMVIKYLADYFSVALENLPHLRALQKIYDENRDTLGDEPEIATFIHFNNRALVWALEEFGDNKLPDWMYSLIWFFIDTTALIVSFLLLIIGLLLLGLSIF